MATSTPFESKLIDELQELGKLSGTEMTVVSYDGQQTRKVSIDTIIGYAASILSNVQPSTMSLRPTYTTGGQCIIVIPEGEELDISERTPGCFYLEETKQTSIRTQMNVPTSVKVSSSLGLRRV